MTCMDGLARPDPRMPGWAQIYCDFSGYTSIAIGCALLLGYRFPRNFNARYTATSAQDFWRRWHISLSSWLRNYLYFPLRQGRSLSEVRRHRYTAICPAEEPILSLDHSPPCGAVWMLRRLQGKATGPYSLPAPVLSCFSEIYSLNV